MWRGVETETVAGEVKQGFFVSLFSVTVVRLCCREGERFITQNIEKGSLQEQKLWQNRKKRDGGEADDT